MPLLNYPNSLGTPLVVTWAQKVAAEFRRILPGDRYRVAVECDLTPDADQSPCVIVDETPNQPTPTDEMPFTVEMRRTDTLAVHITDTQGAYGEVGVVEFVTEGTKASERDRSMFVGRCMFYLRQGIGVIVADAITTHEFNPHNELMQNYKAPRKALLPEGTCAVAAYWFQTDVILLSSWHHAVEVGQSIPSLPMVLKNGPAVMSTSKPPTCKQCKTTTSNNPETPSCFPAGPSSAPRARPSRCRCSTP